MLPLTAIFGKVSTFLRPETGAADACCAGRELVGIFTKSVTAKKERHTVESDEHSKKGSSVLSSEDLRS